MKYLNITLPKGDMEISKIILGTDYFGTTVSEETAFRLLDIFVEAGGNCVDTARVYAAWLRGGKGASEKLIGRWLKTRKNREKMIISTKGGHPPLEKMKSSRLSRKEIESDLDESLGALGVDTIDLYWLHRDSVKIPVEDIMETLAVMVAKGKVRAVGCSNWRTDRIEKANQMAKQNGLVPFCASQIQWSLAASTPEAHEDSTIVCMDEQEYKWYLNEGMPVMAYSSQAKGFFACAATKGLKAINKKAFDRFCTPENIARLERVKEYSAKNGLTPSAVALGYILCNNTPATAIVGCKTEEQLLDTLTAANVDLPKQVVEWLRGQ